MSTKAERGLMAMLTFPGVFLGFIIGSIATMICVWLAGGSLCGECDKNESASDDAGTSEPMRSR